MHYMINSFSFSAKTSIEEAVKMNSVYVLHSFQAIYHKVEEKILFLKRIEKTHSFHRLRNQIIRF